MGNSRTESKAIICHVGFKAFFDNNISALKVKAKPLKDKILQELQSLDLISQKNTANTILRELKGFMALYSFQDPQKAAIFEDVFEEFTPYADTDLAAKIKKSYKIYTIQPSDAVQLRKILPEIFTNLQSNSINENGLTAESKQEPYLTLK
jgi:hypothetical protein